MSCPGLTRACGSSWREIAGSSPALSILFEDDVDLADGLVDVPDAHAVRWPIGSVSGGELDALAVVGGEGAAPGEEVGELRLFHLAAPAAGRAFPDAVIRLPRLRRF